MADYLLYWKAYWADIAEDPEAINFYWHTDAEWFFDKARNDDCLWVTINGGQNHAGEWRLLQRIEVLTKSQNPSKHGRFEIEGNPERSEVFKIEIQEDFAEIIHKLQFASGKRITATGGAIGNALQSPRQLSESDSTLLNAYASTLERDADRISDVLSEFFRQASFYRYHEDFEEFERNYKIRLANALKRAQELLGAGSELWIASLQEAIESEDDNIIDWRHRKPFLNWTRENPEEAARSFRVLWNLSLPLDDRFSLFVGKLNEAGITQPGAQLAIISTLLMAPSAIRYPPVKTESFSNAMKLAGWEPISKANDPFDRYRGAQQFMNALISTAPKYGVDLRDLLDAQGIIWCVSGGWPRIPVPPGWVNDPATREEADQEEYERELQDLESEPDSKKLTPTEKLALVKARRGQGRFRDDLVSYWDCCCLTRCSHLSVLRASHIKPWKGSSNKERLDPFNGLLLLPNLDSAFDRGLITFEDSGLIKISKALGRSDREALGIHAKLRLRKVSPKHLPYLKYHREKIFVHQ